MGAGAGIRAGKAYIELGVSDRMAAGLRGASAKLKAFGRSITAMGTGMATLGATMATPFVLAGRTFASFQDNMLLAKAVTGATGKEFEMLKDKAALLGRTTSFTASQVASIMVELGRAGFTATQVDKMTASVLNLSRATGTEAAQTSGILAATIRQFNLEAGDAVKVSDSLTIAANKSFNTLESIGDAMTYAGPVAASLGMSLDETLALVGALGNVGIQGSAAGTALRRLGTIGAAEAKEMKRIFGVDMLDGDGNMRPLVDSMDDLFEATKDMPTGEKFQKFNEAFGLLGITGALSISGATVSVRELQEALENGEGTAAATAKEMDSGLGGAFRMLTSAVEGVGLAIGEVISGPVSAFMKVFEVAAGLVTGFVKRNEGLVKVLGSIAAILLVAGAALIGFGLIVQVIAVWVGWLAMAATAIGVAFTAMGAILSAALSPFGLAIAGAVYLLWAFRDNLQGVVQGAIGAFSNLGYFIGQTFEGVTAALQAGDFETAFEIITLSLETLWVAFIITVKQAWADLQNFLVDRTKPAVNAIMGMWRQLSETLAKWFANMGYKFYLWMNNQKDYLSEEEKNSARDDSIGRYYDQLESSINTALDVPPAEASGLEELQKRLADVQAKRLAAIGKAQSDLNEATEEEKREKGKIASMPGVQAAAINATSVGAAEGMKAWEKFVENKDKVGEQQLQTLRDISRKLEDGIAIAEAGA